MHIQKAIKPESDTRTPEEMVTEFLAAGMDSAGVIGKLPDRFLTNSATMREVLAHLRAEQNLTPAEGKRIVKAELAGRKDESDSQIAMRQRAILVNKMRVHGGRTMPDTSNERTEFFVIPLGYSEFSQVMAAINETSEDSAPDEFAPKLDWTGEPDKESRTAWIVSLKRNDPTATLHGIRTIPRPVYAVLFHGERHHLVITSDDVAVIVTPEDVNKGNWITKAGSKAATGNLAQDRTREAFRILADECPVYKREPGRDQFGRLRLLPRGIMPPGFRDLAPDIDRDSAKDKWKLAAGIVERSPGGIAAHIWGAVVNSYYVRLFDWQSHAIDIFGISGTGKSVLLKSVGAMIGNPQQTALPCDLASPISATSLAGQIGYGVIPLDETQLFKGDADERARLVFRTCQSGRRTRSLPDGSGVSETQPFGGLLLLTGNTRFVAAETIDKIFSGLSRRYFPVYADTDHPVFKDDIDADNVKDYTYSAYGWLIPLVAESVTADEFMSWVHEIAVSLKPLYPGSDGKTGETRKILAGHLAGCRAIDRLFGTALETAAHPSIANIANAVCKPIADIGELFIDSCRDHAQTNSGKGVTKKEYSDSQVRDGMDIAIGIDRAPVGIKADDNSWFLVLGKPTLDRLCAEFGIADPDAVIIALNRAGLLKLTDTDKNKKNLITRTRVHKQVVAGYYILASITHDGTDIGPEDSGEESATEPSSGPSGPGIAAPFNGRGPDGASVNGAAPSNVLPVAAEMPAEPAAEPPTEPSGTVPAASNGGRAGAGTVAYARPAWIPDPIRKGKDGSYSGIITAFNAVWKIAEVRGKAYPQNHPYPTDNDVPEPLRLLGKDLGTSVHEGPHSYTNSAIPAGTKVTVLDRNAAFLSAIGSAVLPIANVIPCDGAGDEKQTGIYLIESWPEMLVPGPHPWGSIKGILTSKPLWITRATLDLGREMATAGVMEMPTVIRSYLGRVIQAGRPPTVRLERLYAELRSARNNAIAANDADGLGFVKMMYSVGISTMGESTSNRRIWRPEFPPMIRATSFANVYRLAHKFQLAGLDIAGIKYNDEIHIAATPDEIFATGVIPKGRGLNEIKVKGGYAMSVPDSEWSNTHA